MQREVVLKSVLIVSSSQSGTKSLIELMSAQDSYLFQTVSGANQARRQMMEQDYDIILINTPLQEEFGDELSIAAAELRSAGVVLLTGHELADAVAQRVEEFGVFVVSKPIVRPLFYQAMRLVIASHRRIVGLKEQNTKLQNKLQVLKVVARAKCALMQSLKMTEAEAHRYIEKQAMDLRLSKREVAENILKIYET